MASIIRGKGAANSLDLGESGQAVHGHATEKVCCMGGMD